jgi:hypothetical protein
MGVYSMAKLIKDIDFSPIDKFVVKFEKFRTYSAPQSIVDKEKSTADETVTKMVKRPVKFNHQVATIVGYPVTETLLLEDDKILVDFRSCQPIDGYKGLYLIPKYNIIGHMYSSFDNVVLDTDKEYPDLYKDIDEDE